MEESKYIAVTSKKLSDRDVDTIKTTYARDGIKGLCRLPWIEVRKIVPSNAN